MAGSEFSYEADMEEVSALGTGWGIRKAILKTWYSATYTADIRLEGSRESNLDGIKVARNLQSAEMVAGRYLAVLFFNLANPREALVIAVYTP